MTTPLSIYIHWPFCLSKCPYCDFNSHVRDQHDSEAWGKGIISELCYYKVLLPNHHVETIFFGGGTPSLIPPRLVGKIIDKAHNFWPSRAPIEVTLEANPSSAEAQKFRELSSAGVNRFSLGLQSLDEASLRYLGRKHSVQEGLRALEAAQGAVDRVSFDLIYARSHQRLDQWEAELKEALGLGATHVSLYQLTMEPGTAFYMAHQAGRLPLPEADLSADFYTLTESLTQAAGLPAYEISNYAQGGQECRHNLCYWQSGSYIGVGPGAHGRYTCASEGRQGRFATNNHRAPETWLRHTQGPAGIGLKELSPIDTATQLEEALMMGLRLTQGFDYKALLLKLGYGADPLDDALKTLESAGYLQQRAENLRPTLQGRLCLNAVLGYLFKALAASRPCA